MNTNTTFNMSNKRDSAAVDASGHDDARDQSLAARWVIGALAAAAIVVVSMNPAHAAGCISGGAVGAVGGHVAGHHAVLGAAAGCAVGHHMNKKEEKAKADQQKAAAPQPGASAPGKAG